MENRDILQKIEFILERGTISTDVEKNLAKGHVPVIGMRYKKKRRFNPLTGMYVTVYEEEKIDEEENIEEENDLNIKVNDIEEKEVEKGNYKEKSEEKKEKPKTRFGNLLRGNE